MTTDSKERDALTAYLKDCEDNAIAPDVGGAFHYAFMAGRASLAASAGGEPVAIYHGRCVIDCGAHGHLDVELLKMIPAGSKLYTRPSPQEGMVGGWTTLPGTMPEPGIPVLLDIGKKYPIRALWAAKHTVETAQDDTDWAEYDEASDCYYCPEGWYEWNQQEEIHWAVNDTPRAWAPLPPPPTSADKGE